MTPPDSDIEMEAAVQRLYRTFQSYRLRPDFAGCDHCVDPRHLAHLAGTPLRELTLQHLDPYSFKAMTTIGDARDFKHFLPRLFELAAADPESFLSFEVLLSKLDYAKWEEWPDFEQQAIDQFLQVLWRSEIGRDISFDNDSRIDTVLCGLGRACRDLSTLLALWISDEQRDGCRLLAQFVLLNIDTLRKHNGLENAYWNGRHQQVEQVTAWLRSAAVYAYLFDHQAWLDDRLKAAVAALADWPSLGVTS